MTKFAPLLALVLTASCASSGDSNPALPLLPSAGFEGWSFQGPENDAAPFSAWRRANGILLTDGSVPGALRTLAEHADYEVSFDWRWGPGVSGGNSGLLVHAGEPRVFHGWPRCLEVQLRSGNAGDFILMDTGLSPKGGTLDGVRIARRPEVTERPEGEWNTMRVRCDGDEVVVWVNGVLANHGRNASRARGAIALQSEGAEIHFRNLVLRQL